MSKKNNNMRKRSNSLNARHNKILLNEEDKEDMLSKSILLPRKKEMMKYKIINNIDISTFDFIFAGRVINNVNIKDFDTFISLLNNIKKKFNPLLFENCYNYETIANEGKFSLNSNNLTDLIIINSAYNNYDDIDISINNRYIKIEESNLEKNINLYGTKSFFKGKHCFEIEIIDLNKKDLYIGLMNLSFIENFKSNINNIMFNNNNNNIFELDQNNLNVFKIEEPFFIKKNETIYNHFMTYGDIIGFCYDLDKLVFYIFLNGEIINTKILKIETGPNCSFVPFLALGSGSEIIFNPGSTLKYGKNYSHYGFIPLDEYNKNTYETSQLTNVTDEYIDILYKHGKTIISNKNITYSDINQIYHIIFEFLGNYSFQESYIIDKSIIKKLFIDSPEKIYNNDDFEIIYTILKFILNATLQKKLIIKNIFLNLVECIHINIKKGNISNNTLLNNIFNLLIFLLNKEDIQEILDTLPKTVKKIFNGLFVSLHNNKNELFKKNQLDFIIQSNNGEYKDNDFPKLLITKEELEKSRFLNLIKYKKNYDFISGFFSKLITSIYQNGHDFGFKLLFRKFKKYMEKEISNMRSNCEKKMNDFFKTIFIPSMNNFNKEYQKNEKMNISIKHYLFKNESNETRIGGRITKVYDKFNKTIENFEELLSFPIINPNNIFFMQFISLFFINKNNNIIWTTLDKMISDYKNNNINSIFDEKNESNNKPLFEINYRIEEHINSNTNYLSIDDLNILVKFFYNITHFILNDLYPKQLIYFLPESLLVKMINVFDLVMEISQLAELSQKNIKKFNFNDKDINNYIQESLSNTTNLKNLCLECLKQYISFFVKILNDDNIRERYIKYSCDQIIKNNLHLEHLFKDNDIFDVFNFINLKHNNYDYRFFVLDFMSLFDTDMKDKDSKYYNFGQRLVNMLKTNADLLRILIILLYNGIYLTLSKVEEKFGEYKFIPRNSENQNRNQNSQISINNNMIMINNININDNDEIFGIQELDRINRALRIGAPFGGRRIVVIGVENSNANDRNKLLTLSFSFEEAKKEFLKLNNFYRLTSEIKALYEINSFEYKKLYNLLLSLYNIIFLPSNIEKIENKNNNNNEEDENDLNIVNSYSQLLKIIYAFFDIIISNITKLNDNEILKKISKDIKILHFKEILQIFEKYDPPKDGYNHMAMQLFIENLEKIASEEEVKKENGNEEKEDTNNNKENNICTICSDSSIDTHLIPCNHTMCRNCFYQLLFEKKTCPFCRIDIKGIQEDPNFKI